jgi:hypothetical protein
MKKSIAALAATLLSLVTLGAAAAPGTNLNGDTTSDLLYRNVATGQVYRMLMSGFTVLNGAMAYTEPDTNWKVIADADFNGDGVTDLLWRNDVNGQVYMQPFTAGGLPAPGTVFYTEPSAAWKIVATPDFNGDGKADLLWWNSANGQLYGMVMNGATITAQGIIYTEPDTVWQIVATGDFAGSGKKNQVVYRNASNGQVYLMTVNFNGATFSQTGVLIYTEPDTNWKIIHAADFNGDGKTDLLWRNEVNGQVYMMLMNGGAILSAGIVYSEPNLQWKVAAVGDYNGDGKADLLFRNEASGTLFQAQMNGLAITSQAIIYQEPNIGWKVLGAWEYQGNGSLYPWKSWTPAIPAVRPSTTGFTYYVDGANGINTNNGKSPIAAYKTLAKALSVIAAGDTVLIRKGLYRESLDLSTASVPTGTAAKPITIGSYGDGEVIIDGSKAVTGWVNVSGTVWKATGLTFTPIGIVVNEVPLKQVRQGQGGSSAPQEGVAGVTSGSGKWHYTAANGLTADFGTTIGAGDPNLVGDIVVPNNTAAQQHVFFFGQNFITFKGLTIRGSGSNGVWGYGKNITVDSCNVKFNGKAGVSYLNDSATGVINSDNAVLYTHVYHNVLSNWPRGNNGNAEAGGGWPGTVVWDTNLRPLARGNVVHFNGGEGVISYGTHATHTSGSALFEQNVIYDNWSVNIYFDNQPNDVARENFLFNHPPNSADWLYNLGSYADLGKFSVCLMLADEQNSSDSTNSFANLANSQVYNNILAGCRIGIRDYSEGATTIPNHGLKNTLIANNTIIMSNATYNNSSVYGIYLQDNGAKNTGTVIQNNVIQGFNSDPLVFTESTGTLTGINLDYNGYFSTATQPFGAGFNTVNFYNFAQWKVATPGTDTHSLFAAPLLVDSLGFRATSPGVYEYFRATLLPSSPLQAAGAAQTYTPTTNFSHIPRAVWGIGAQ